MQRATSSGAMEYPSMELVNRGSIVSCQTCFNQTIEGGVMAFDPTTKMLILSILFIAPFLSGPAYPPSPPLRLCLRCLFSSTCIFLNRSSSSSSFSVSSCHTECAPDSGQTKLNDVYVVNLDLCSKVEIKQEVNTIPNAPPLLNLQRVST